jgi:hypothetical protein
VVLTKALFTLVHKKHIYRTSLKHVGAPGRLIIWCPLKSSLFELFIGLEQGWRKFLRVRAKIADNFWRNSFACGNRSLLAPYFRLFQRRQRAPYSLALRAAAQWGHPLNQPCVYAECIYNRQSYAYVNVCTYRLCTQTGSHCTDCVHGLATGLAIGTLFRGSFISRNLLFYIVSAPRYSKWCIHTPFHNQNIVHVFLSCVFCKYYLRRFKYPSVIRCGKQSSLRCLCKCNKGKQEFLGRICDARFS